jgi:Domain of unknown function (DUF4430)
VSRPRQLAPLAVLVVAFAGCGLGAGPAPKGVQLLVTNDFGSHALGLTKAPEVKGQETVMALLLRNHHVETRYGGAFVQSIEGLSGGHEGARPVDWFYYVNGVQAPKGAAATNVDKGDHIWWDRHDWSQTESVPAVVGSFPEPFLNGVEGKRLPVRVECGSVGGYACRTVTERLRAAGVPAAIAGLGSGGETESLRLLVAPWPEIGDDLTAESIARGPRASGVYVRIARDGALSLLDADGKVVQTLSRDAGLIAATRRQEDEPVWVVTGTDEAGTEAAARDFNATALADHFALAIDSGRAIPLPVEGAP